MTKILFKKNQFLYAVECQGHTGFANSGEDILCSAISALVQSTFLGLTKVLKLNVNFNRNDKKGVFEFAIDVKQAQQAETLMETLYLSLKDIEIGNEKFMKVEVQNEVY